MVNEKNGTITLQDENGNDVVVQVVLEFELPELKKKYLAYTKDANTDKDIIDIFISEFDYDTNELKSIPEDEYKDVIECYNNIKESLLEENNN